MKLYEVPGHDRPLLLSEDHAKLLEATPVREVPLPARNASADTWRDYAVTQGYDRGVVADLSRSELVETFGD